MESLKPSNQTGTTLHSASLPISSTLFCNFNSAPVRLRSPAKLAELDGYLRLAVRGNTDFGSWSEVRATLDRARISSEIKSFADCWRLAGGFRKTYERLCVGSAIELAKRLIEQLDDSNRIHAGLFADALPGIEFGDWSTRLFLRAVGSERATTRHGAFRCCGVLCGHPKRTRRSAPNRQRESRRRNC